MHRRRVAYVVLGAVVLLVVAMSAATLTTTERVPGGGAGEAGETGQPASDETGSTEGGIMLYALFGIVLVAALAAVVSSLRHPVSALRGALEGLGGGAIAALMIAIALWLMQQPSDRDVEEAANVTRNNSSGGSGVGEGVGDAAGDVANSVLNSPSVVLVAFLGLAVIGLVAMVLVGREQRGVDESFTAGEPTDTLSAMARVAGEAADRLEGDAAAENEVYRAWKQMTGLLDLDDPVTRTPGEFRRAAVEAGMAPDDVDELTELFEDVRYGGAAPTPVREDRASEALRNIERTYGGPR